ncbi:two-component sensor histidine kinase [Oerskovia sp. Sa1BUA8]|uniref:histidine kinase n=1 Tax=Oerskovia douganii TaxID=2762210 RepID=A0A9D5YXN1_9CELL|nr:histidine kinase [Oerskovia douganii]MBE7699773.1 two-component sensor histidine kinase [Oerskovia douganii]
MSNETSAPPPVFTELSARRLGPVRRYLVRHPVVVDVLLVVCFAAWASLMGLGADSMYVLHAYLGGEQVLQMQLTSLALTVCGAVALCWRRRRPVLVAVVMSVLGVAALAATGATSGFEVGVAIALYAVARSRRPVVTWAVCAASVAALLVGARLLPLATTVGAISMGLDPGDAAEAAAGRVGAFLQSAVWYQTAVPVLVLALLAVALGTSVRNRRLHVAAFVDAANALARDLEQRERLAQAAERARIAREMHDVVAHSISVMVALGGGAAAAIDWAPDRSRTALDELVATGRSALGDMRRVLDVLHDDDGDGADGPVAAAGTPASDVGTPASTVGGAPLEPQPGTPDLTALVERFRTADLPVTASGLTDAGLDGLDASMQLAVYRMVQEALTNVLRHAPGTPAVEVGVTRGREHVEVIVTDGGPTVPVEPAHGAQRGLVGMRERAAVFGGTVEAGRNGAGWQVRAVLPLNEGVA